MKYDKSKVFISSRNTYEVDGENLSDIRKQVSAAIEERFPFLEVRINEGWTSKPKSPREASIEGARECDLFIGILVADAGFTDKSGLSATHEEFDAAADLARQKMLVFAEQRLTDKAVAAGLPGGYRDLYDQWTSYRRGLAITYFTTGEDLKQRVLQALDAHCARSVTYWGERARSGAKTTEDTMWELMTFTERHDAMVKAFHTYAKRKTGLHLRPGLSVDGIAESKGRYVLAIASPQVDIPVILSACPDRFSYPEAAKYVGYPFRTEVESWRDELGPLHIVLVYKTITDTQVRRHLGNPDIHVSREDWGFFAADPERFIQIAYLSRCTDSHEIMQRTLDFMTWLDEYDQVRDLVIRSQVRGKILQARASLT